MEQLRSYKSQGNCGKKNRLNNRVSSSKGINVEVHLPTTLSDSLHERESRLPIVRASVCPSNCGALAIREYENIHGLKINDTELKLGMYVDDLTAFIKDECSASHLFSLLNGFGTCSGLKINFSKTEGMWLWKPKMPLRQTSSI